MLNIRPDGQALVMPKIALIVEANLPSSFLLLCFGRSVGDFVAHNLDLACFGSYKLDQECTDDRSHPTTQDDDRDAHMTRPPVEVTEEWVKLDVLAKEADALWKRRGHRIHHGLEGVT